jgi:hypothetical protein
MYIQKKDFWNGGYKFNEKIFSNERAFLCKSVYSNSNSFWMIGYSIERVNNINKIYMDLIDRIVGI